MSSPPHVEPFAAFLAERLGSSVFRLNGASGMQDAVVIAELDGGRGDRALIGRLAQALESCALAVVTGHGSLEQLVAAHVAP